MSRQRKEPANLKIGQLKLSSLRNRGKKKEKDYEQWTEHEGCVGFHTNISTHTMGIQGEREKEKEKILEEIMAINFQNMKKDMNLHSQEAQQTPGRISAKRSTWRHVKIKLLKASDKEKNLKSSSRETTCHIQEIFSESQKNFS